MALPPTSFDVYSEASLPPLRRELWQDGPALLKFSATWCGPCKRVAPFFAAYALESKGRLTCHELDVEKDSKVAEYYHIRLLPTFLLLQDGAEVDRIESGDWDRVSAKLLARHPAASLPAQGAVGG